MTQLAFSAASLAGCPLCLQVSSVSHVSSEQSEAASAVLHATAPVVLI